jgi:hypothetical protein
MAEASSKRQYREEASWDIMRQHGGGIVDETSWTGHHRGGIMEKPTWRHLRQILETSGRRQGCIREPHGFFLKIFGDILEARGRSGAS